MRRLLAIAIALILGLPAVSPIFALTGIASPNLPACCLRDGKHHCMAMAGMPSVALSDNPQAKAATITDRCPYGSHSLPGTPNSGSALDTSAAIFAGIFAHPTVSPQTKSKRRISAERSRQKRGPPASNPA